MNEKLKEQITPLVKALMNIQTEEEMYNFLDDICSIKELEQLSQRLEAAKMLLEDETYEEVIEKTSISSATLSRVSKCIHHGKGGYLAAIKPIQDK